tara:strand:- start:1934 stop:2212 length:279 start_codon:yes stop_codon:yes gene_type:complete
MFVFGSTGRSPLDGSVCAHLFILIDDVVDEPMSLTTPAVATSLLLVVKSMILCLLIVPAIRPLVIVGFLIVFFFFMYGPPFAYISFNNSTDE